MSRKWLVWMLLFLWTAGAACSGKGEGKEPGEKAAGRPLVAVEVTKVFAGDVTEGVEIIGALAPKFRADVKSEYAGIVTDVYVTQWVKVNKGVPLAKIDSREADILAQKARAAVELAKANLLQAEVSSNRAGREYDRLLKLKEFGLATQQSLDEGLTEKDAVAARIAAAQAQLRAAEEDLRHVQMRLSKTTVCAPMDGIVSFRGVNVGDLVGEMGSPKIMFCIINPHVLELTVNVPSADMGSLRIGQSLVFYTDVMPGRTFAGKVMFINPMVNEADRSVKVTAEVENLSEQLKGGLFVKGRIITGKRNGILRIPRNALLSWDVAGKKGDVFVISGEAARRRTVQTGSVMGDSVEVASGLSSGEAVVTRGGFNLKDGDRVEITQVNGG
jgi:membrane fusion protein, multidrug efflux system